MRCQILIMHSFIAQHYLRAYLAYRNTENAIVNRKYKHILQPSCHISFLPNFRIRGVSLAYSEFFCCWNLGSTPGLNFINVLRTAFTYVSCESSYFVLTFQVCTLLAQDCWRKSCVQIVGEIDPRCVGCLFTFLSVLVLVVRFSASTFAQRFDLPTLRSRAFPGQVQ